MAVSNKYMNCFHIVRPRLCTHLGYTAYMLSIISVCTTKDGISNNNIISTLIHFNVTIQARILSINRIVLNACNRAVGFSYNFMRIIISGNPADTKAISKCEYWAT